MLLVTYQCNLRCVYCYEPKTVKKQMSAEQAECYISRIVENVDDTYDDFEVQFMGGEPLVVFDIIKEVSEWLWKQQFRIPLTQIFAVTNGTLIDSRNRQWFVSNKERFCLGLSFDGDRLMQNLNRSDSANKVDLTFFATTWPNQTVKVTISPLTIGRLYEGVVSLHKIGFKSITADLAMGKIIGWNDSHLSVLYEQMERLTDYYLANPNVNPFSLLQKNIWGLEQRKNMNKMCGCGEDLVCIDCDGEEYACHLFSPITIGKERALEVKETINFCDHEKFGCKECKDCLLQSLCSICHGMNYIMFGKVDMQSDFICKANKIVFLCNCEFENKKAIVKGDKDKQRYINKLIEQVIKS